MDSLNLADTFITFFALFGPQKVLLSFARLSRTVDPEDPFVGREPFHLDANVGRNFLENLLQA